MEIFIPQPNQVLQKLSHVIQPPYKQVDTNFKMRLNRYGEVDFFEFFFYASTQ